MKQALILAGGKGTRLRERLGDLPKPLIDVCGTPLLERQILLLKQHGFERILILVNYRAEAIADFCAQRDSWGLDIRCIDDGEPRGTAGAVLQVLDQLDEEFLVVYGDTMLQVDLGRFQAFHRQVPDVAASLFLHPNDHPQDSDLVELDEQGFVRGFHPYPHPVDAWLPNLVNAALYVIRREALRPWRDAPGMLDFGKDVFPEMLRQGLRLRGYNSPEYIKDVGTPSRIDKVSADLLSGRIARAGLDHAQMAVFLDRDGTINREVDHLCRAEDFELLPGVEQAVRSLNQAEYRVCVVTNQPVLARGECSVEDLRRVHNKMETLLGRAGAYVDRIDYCPHHPDAGFAGEVPELKRICDCRKPATGMIDAAVSALNIDRARSWMIGDTTTDVLTAARAGMRSILVESGYGGLDARHFVAPDFVAPDLVGAVAFILDGHARLLHALQPWAQRVAAGDIVFIGGQSRGGKSTTAAALREIIAARGLECHVLSTDRWLRSESDRGDGVEGRHHIEALREVLTRLGDRAQTLELSLPGYVKLRRLHVPEVEALRIEPRDVVIVEGVVALAAASVLPHAHRMVVRSDEGTRRQRIQREYARRGESVRADEIYTSRLRDEWPWIEASSEGADRFELPECLFGENTR